jgi:hypothetical protein
VFLTNRTNYRGLIKYWRPSLSVTRRQMRCFLASFSNVTCRHCATCKMILVYFRILVNILVYKQTQRKLNMCLSSHQNAAQNHNLMTANKSFQKFGKVQIFGDHNKSRLLLRRNSEQIKFRECLLPFSSDLLPSCLLPKNLWIRIYKSVILLVFFFFFV